MVSPTRRSRVEVLVVVGGRLDIVGSQLQHQADQPPVAPEKTQVLRFSRFHPSMTRRVTPLGFELFWFLDPEGTSNSRKLQYTNQSLVRK